ncbi:MAG TPA: DUF4410 domain-containing protein, partial [Solirubrobacterales bacterium]|nr:DUF4410 domain-containing protein [Solirubrobacterales bacterium]
DNTYEPVTEVLKDPAQPFIEGLAEGLGGRAQVAPGTAAEGPALLVRAKVVTMDPGSRAARYWASFSAGAARTELEGEAVDAATGKTLFRFKQERRSGWGVGGGGYVKLMNKNLRTIGKDVAFVLARF